MMSRIGRGSRRENSRSNRSNRLSRKMRMIGYEIERCSLLENHYYQSYVSGVNLDIHEEQQVEQED